jgi:signal transduction histidine kinase
VDNIFDKESEINLFRLIQEALNNIIKHSQAKEADVKITKDDKMIHVTISDDGKGMVTTTSERKMYDGFGLIVMSERVKMLKGSLNCVSTPGTGTMLLIDIPL